MNGRLGASSTATRKQGPSQDQRPAVRMAFSAAVLTPEGGTMKMIEARRSGDRTWAGRGRRGLPLVARAHAALASGLGCRRVRRAAQAVMVAVAMLAFGVAVAAPPPVGGGFTAAGVDGEYFANTSFSGPAAFKRHDVRIHFDWKEGAVAGFAGLPVGGAPAPCMGSFPTDDFSIRWSGRLVPRFTETYTFRVTGYDGARFKLGPAGGAPTTLVDNLNKAGASTASFAMKAGAKYDLVFEYVDRAGTNASKAILEWSSPSTPWEVIDPLAIGLTAEYQAFAFQWGMRYANLMLNPSGPWTDPSGRTPLAPADMDADGWPKMRGVRIQLANCGFYHGTYKLRFKGKAQVQVTNTRGDTISFSGVSDGGATKPVSFGYDAANNVTEAVFVASGNTPNGTGTLYVTLTDASRDASGAAPGFTKLEVMAPVEEGADQSHDFGELRLRKGREVFAAFVVERHQGLGLSDKGVHDWTDRNKPTSYWPLGREDGTKSRFNIEHEIMLANEQGHDIHFNYSPSWTTDFMRNVARLVRYGSDAQGNPHTDYVANPAFPPLNPNLRIYLEHGNETGWSAVSPHWIGDELHQKAVADHPDWRIVNYDGRGVNPGKTLGPDTSDGALSYLAIFRYHALLTKQMSDAFRTVCGDDEMGDRVRVCLFGQYVQPHQNVMLQFLDDYFNNGDGVQHVADPHPPNYSIWGSGGAVYYSGTNKFGLQEPEPIANHDFAAPALSPGTTALRPTDAGWTFGGNAGVCDVTHTAEQRLPAVAGQTLGTAVRQSKLVGLKFTVGAADLYVYQLGRWKSPGNGGTHAMHLFEYDPVAGKSVQEAAWAGNKTNVTLNRAPDNAYAYAYHLAAVPGGYGFRSGITPLRLQAGKSYCLVSQETQGGDTFCDDATTVAAAPGLTIDGAVTAIGVSKPQGAPDGYDWFAPTVTATGSRSWGPVNMIYTTRKLATAEGVVGVPPDLSQGPQKDVGHDRFWKLGDQCAFLAGGPDGCSMTQTVTVPKAGAYWITWNMCRDWEFATSTTVRVKVDGEVVCEQPPKYGCSFWYHATAIFPLTAGKHSILFEKPGAAGTGTVYIDEVRLSSVADFYGGPGAESFPAGGNATGQNADDNFWSVVHAECAMALNWGTVPTTYEGGWAVKGDFDGNGMFHDGARRLAWDDLAYGGPLVDPALVAKAQANALDIWSKGGGFVYSFLYEFERFLGDPAAPQLLGLKQYNDRWVREATDGAAIPGVLTCAEDHYQGAPIGTGDYRGPTAWGKANRDPKLSARQWKSWLVIAPATGSYDVRLHASGGAAQLRVDDSRLLAQGDTAGQLHGVANLIKGIHAIKVKALGDITIEKIVVSNAADGERPQD